MELCVCGEIKEILGKGNGYMKQILTGIIKQESLIHQPLL